MKLGGSINSLVVRGLNPWQGTGLMGPGYQILGALGVCLNRPTE